MFKANSKNNRRTAQQPSAIVHGVLIVDFEQEYKQ